MRPKGNNTREYKMECLARWVLDRPTKEHAEHFIYRYTERNGIEARKELIEYMRQEKAKREQASDTDGARQARGG